MPGKKRTDLSIIPTVIHIAAEFEYKNTRANIRNKKIKN